MALCCATLKVGSGRNPSVSQRGSPASVQAGFVVDRLALGQVSLRVLRFCCVNYHSTDTPHSLTCHVGDENEGQSRPQFHRDKFQPHHYHNNEYTTLYTARHETSNGVAVAYFCLNVLGKMVFGGGLCSCFPKRAMSFSL